MSGGQRRVDGYGTGMTTVAITGIGGLLGRALVTRLRAQGDAGDAGGGPDTADAPSGGGQRARTPHGVQRIVGFDVITPDRLDPAGVPAVELHVVDVRDPRIVDALRGVDVLVHLAFQMDPIRDLDAMRSINLDGTRNVLACAREADVRRVIYLSSVVAYGAYADNDVPLTEASPLRGQPGFPYAEHKREVEDWLWPWHAAGDGPALTVLRSAAVFGPGVQNFFTRVMELPALPMLPDAPPLQFVHVDDVIGAIVHAITHDLDGAFNVAPDGWLDFDQVVALVGRPTFDLEPDAMRRLAERSYRFGIGELTPAVVELFQQPWVMANGRLRGTGWVPTRTNEEALLETVVEHADHVALGRLRTTRRTLRLAAAAAVLGLTAAALAALRRR